MKIRLQQLERAHAQFLLLSQLDQPGRTHTVFKEGDIVLVALSPAEIFSYARVEKNTKITPKFSMPARVVRVASHGKSAIVRHFGSGRTQEVHVQNARFVSLPTCPNLFEQWSQLATTHANGKLTDEDKRAKYVKKFWEEIHEPQVQALQDRRHASSVVECRSNDSRGRLLWFLTES